MRISNKWIVAVSIIPQIILVKILGNYPEFIERFYSHGIYVFISKCMRFALGWLPFSFGDLVYIIGLVYIIRWLFINRKRIINDFKSWCIDVFVVVSVLYFAFHLFWGMNYYRVPLHQQLQIDDSYSTEALILVTKKFIEKSNGLYEAINGADSVLVKSPYTQAEILDKIPDGYFKLKNTFEHLDYSPKSIKTSLLSLPLTYMGFSGYLNPLTLEAQIDGLIPLYKIPTTASHEVAHQLGYAAENEANFIGYLATIQHDDLYFKYSGYTFGLRFCLNELYKRNPEAYDETIKTVNPGILKNYEEVRQFWDSYKNKSQPVFKTTYNNFLKANSQDKGMESYNYVVALLVNYHLTEAL